MAKQSKKRSGDLPKKAKGPSYRRADHRDFSVFISFAGQDRTVAKEIAKLIRQTACIPDHAVFLANPKSIPNGIPFSEHIFTRLNQSDLAVLYISEHYLTSQFCLGEAGAAYSRSIDGKCTLQIFTPPGFHFDRLPPFLDKLQAGKITDKDSLGELRKAISHECSNDIPFEDWEEKRNAFLDGDSVGKLLAGDLANRITIRNMTGEIDRTVGRGYPCKLRVELVNQTGKPVLIESAHAAARTTGKSLFMGPEAIAFQVKRAGEWSDEKKTDIHVEPEEITQFWLGIKPPFASKEEIEREANKEQIAAITIKLKIGSHPTTKQFNV